MLVVSRSSQGIWALTMVGETIISGAAMPLKKTCVPPSLVGSEACVVSAEAVWDERLVPVTDTMVPGAIWDASPAPDRVLPPAVAAICAAVALAAAATVTLTVIALPAVPEVLE